MEPSTIDVLTATGLPLLSLRPHAPVDTPVHHVIDVASGGPYAFSLFDPQRVSYLTDAQIEHAARIAAAGPLLLWAIRDALNAMDVHERIDNPGEDSIIWEHHADHLKLAYRAATGEEWPS